MFSDHWCIDCLYYMEPCILNVGKHNQIEHEILNCNATL